MITGRQQPTVEESGTTTTSRPLQTIGIVPHLSRPQALDLTRQMIDRLESKGLSVRVPTTDALLTELGQWAHADETFGDGLDMAFSLGGDGTMLRTVDLVSEFGVPVLGVNVGHLGYLAAVQPDMLDVTLEQVLLGNHDIEDRMRLAIEVHPDGNLSGTPLVFHALNDAVLEKSSAGNTVRLGVSFNGVPFTDYAADGLIIATPTGSTAYAFSARGPIVSPLMRALVVVPVSPHMLFDRSLVLDGSESVQMEVLSGRPATLFVDGRDCGLLNEGAVVVCRAAERPARLVTISERDFHGILKVKFGLIGPRSQGRSIGDDPDALNPGDGQNAG
jgi:NAD+ kinase